MFFHRISQDQQLYPCCQNRHSILDHLTATTGGAQNPQPK